MTRTSIFIVIVVTALIAGGASACKDDRDACFRDQEAAACRRVCGAGDTGACGAADYAEARAGDTAKQEKLCQRGDMFMCLAVADRQPDGASRRKVLADACAQGDVGAPACAHLADMIGDPIEKRQLLERTCATRWGLLACGRLADIEPDPALRKKRLADVCVAGLEDQCAPLITLVPSTEARRALLVEACRRNAEDCALHPIEWAFRKANVPVDPPKADGGDKP